MRTITEDVERLVPTSSGSPLLRGLLLGALVGATIAGVLVVRQAMRARHERNSPPPPLPPSGPGQGAEPSPL